MVIRLILFLFFFINLAVNAKDENDFYPKINQTKNYFIEYGSNKIPAHLIENNQKKKLLVIGREMDLEMGEIIILQRPNKDGAGRIIFPLKDGGYHLEWLVPDAYKEAITCVEQSKFSQAITLIRPHVYPLIAYLDIKNEVFNIHRPVLFLIKILFENEQWGEAFSILSRIPYKKVNSNYQNFAFKLLEQYINLKQPTLAIQLFGKVFNSHANLQLQEQMMDFAYLLLQSDYPYKALYIYKKIINIHNFRNIRECRLWQAYCHLQMKKPELTKIFIDKLGIITPDQREFSLYLFVQSQLDLLEDRYKDAIAKLSRAIVYAPAESRWLPELMYTSGNVYKKIHNIEASESIHRQVTVFFPNTFWSNKSRQIISGKNR